MKIFPYKDIYIITNLSKREVYTAFKGYSSRNTRIDISHTSLNGKPDWPESFFFRYRFGVLRIVDVHFIGDAKEAHGQTTVYGTVELGIVQKLMFFLSIAVTMWLFESAPIIVLPAVAAVGLLMYLFIKSNVKKYTPFFEEKIKGILKIAERIKEEGRHAL